MTQAIETQRQRLKARQPAYSRAVRFLKVILPVTAISLITSAFAYTYARTPDAAPLPHTLAQLGEKPKMLNPRFFGIDADQKPFELSARSASVVGTENPSFVLEDLQASYQEAVSGEAARSMVSALSAFYDGNSRTVRLQGDVDVDNGADYNLRTNDLLVDLVDRTAKSLGPVESDSPVGVIKADGVKIYENGRRIQFTGDTALKTKQPTASAPATSQE